MKVIIIEDEKLTADHLKNLLKKIDDSIEVIAVYDTVKKSIEAFAQGQTADLLFVDIHLADGISFEIFDKVKINLPVIFTTAFDRYAIQAFKVNSVSYLLKPIGKEDLSTALDKFHLLNDKISNSLPVNITEILASIGKQYKSRFMVKMGDTIVSQRTEDVAYFISEDGLVLLVNKSGKRYALDYTLDQLSTLVSPEQFFRINRKVLIAIDSIGKVSSYFNSRLKLTVEGLGEEESIISRERVNDFKTWLDK